MDTNQRQIAPTLLERLRAHLLYAHLKSGRRVLDLPDLRQYFYEQIVLVIGAARKAFEGRVDGLRSKSGGAS
jgi:hypothetical protein